MTYQEAKKIFRITYKDLYENEVDYWTAQECWSNMIDIMCKNGDITQRQWNNWETPFPYGKRLRKPKTIYTT